MDQVNIIIEEGTVELDLSTHEVTLENSTLCVEIDNSGPQGAPGPQGPPGDEADRPTFPVSEPIGAPRLVVHDGTGLRIADPLDEQHGGQLVGVSLTSAAGVGERISVQSAGPLTHSSFSFIPGLPVFANEFGVITQDVSTPVGRVWQTVLGHAISGDTVFLDFDDTTFLC